MYDNDYLEKILGEQYNMSNYFTDTYTEPNVKIIETSNNADINNEKQKNDTKEVLAEPASQNSLNIEESNKIEELEKQEEIQVSDNPIIKEQKSNRKELSNHLEIQNAIKDSIKVDNLSRKNLNADINESHQYKAIQVNKEEVLNNNYIEVSNMYPDIYNAIEPIVELLINNSVDNKIDEEFINTMTDKIYYAVEPNSKVNSVNTIKVNTLPYNKGTVIPVNTRSKNNLLRDLIKILILNNLVNHNSQRPNRPHDHHHNKKTCPRCRNVLNNITYNDLPFPEDE